MISFLKNCPFKTVSCGSAKNKINLDRCGKYPGQLYPLPSLLDRPSCGWTTVLQVLEECVLYLIIPLPSLLDRPSCRWATGLQVLQECVLFHPSVSLHPFCKPPTCLQTLQECVYLFIPQRPLLNIPSVNHQHAYCSTSGKPTHLFRTKCEPGFCIRRRSGTHVIPTLARGE